jgi:hypothetical protein
LVWYKFGKLLKSNLNFGPSAQKYATILAFLGAAVAWKLASRIWDWLIKKIFGYEALNACDEMFLYYNENQAPIVIGSFTTKAFDFKNMQEFFYKNLKSLHRSQVKLVEVFGRSYFATMPDEEWLRKRDKVFIEVKDVHTHAQYHKFITELLQTEIDLMDNVPYRYFMIPDYKNGEGRIILLMNHIYCDGLGGLQHMAGLERNWDNFPDIPKMPFWLDKYYQVISPLTALQVLINQ